GKASAPCGYRARFRKWPSARKAMAGPSTSTWTTSRLPPRPWSRKGSAFDATERTRERSGTRSGTSCASTTTASEFHRSTSKYIRTVTRYDFTFFPSSSISSSDTRAHFWFRTVSAALATAFSAAFAKLVGEEPATSMIFCTIPNPPDPDGQPGTWPLRFNGPSSLVATSWQMRLSMSSVMHAIHAKPDGAKTDDLAPPSAQTSLGG